MNEKIMNVYGLLTLYHIFLTFISSLFFQAVEV